MKLPGWVAGRLRKLFFDAAYWRKPPWDTGITPPEVCAFVSANPPGRVLDLGCGTGTNALYLAQNGWEAWGIDFSARAIRIGKRKARQAGQPIQFLCADVSQALSVPGTFDLILDIGCLHTLPPERRNGYAQNLMNYLRPGGTYLLYGFLKTADSPESTGLQAGDFERLLACLDLQNQTEGKDPNGRSSVWMEYRRKA